MNELNYNFEDFNEYGDPKANYTLTLFGGHKATIFSPEIVRVTIFCSFPLPAHPTLDQQQFVISQTERVVSYLFAEGVLSKTNDKLNIVILTEHKKESHS